MLASVLRIGGTGASASSGAKIDEPSDAGPSWKQQAKMMRFPGMKGGVVKPQNMAVRPSEDCWILFAKVIMCEIAGPEGGKTTMPPYTGSGCGCARKVKEVMMPNMWPAPRTAQKRSGSEVAEQVAMRPSASTISAESRLSIASPYRPDSQPKPPPVV